MRHGGNKGSLVVGVRFVNPRTVFECSLHSFDIAVASRLNEGELG